MAVPKNVGLDCEAVADDAFDRPLTAIQARCHSFNDYVLYHLFDPLLRYPFLGGYTQERSARSCAQPRPAIPVKALNRRRPFGCPAAGLP